MDTRSDRRTGRRRLIRINWAAIATAVVIIGLWELCIRLNWISFNYISAPTEIAVALRDLFRDGVLMERIWHTTLVAARAALIAAVVGVVAGVAIGRIERVRTYSTASIDFMRSIPVLALFPAAVLLWGPTSTSEIAIAAYAATWPMLLNTAAGVRSIHPRLHDVARMLHLRRRERLTKVVIPAALPPILVGLRLSVGSALIVAIVAEMIINPRGVGWGLVESSASLQPPRMWAYAVVAGLLGYAANAFVMRIVTVSMPSSRAAQRGQA